jgi:cobyrinic acid a,c-diamide synthase
MITPSATLPSFGWIPRRDDIGLASRHLGLVMAHESDSLRAAGEIMEEHADIDAIVAAARSAPPLKNPVPVVPAAPPRTTIAVAFDRAFCFYYQDNLDLLRQAGAELVFFSPLCDEIPDADALYLGGGYPELHLPALESSPFTNNLRYGVEGGLPVYAECGGLIALTRKIEDGKTYRMAGVFPADAAMTKKIQALGYVKGGVTETGSILSGPQPVIGHEFHYSHVIPDRDARYALRLSRGKGIDSGMDGLMTEQATGTYTHAYFSKTMAEDIVAAAVRYRRDQ